MSGPRIPITKLTEDDVRKIRALATGEDRLNYNEIARRYGLNSHTVSNIVRNLIPKWKDVK